MVRHFRYQILELKSQCFYCSFRCSLNSKFLSTFQEIDGAIHFLSFQASNLFLIQIRVCFLDYRFCLIICYCFRSIIYSFFWSHIFNSLNNFLRLDLFWSMINWWFLWLNYGFSAKIHLLSNFTLYFTFCFWFDFLHFDHFFFKISFSPQNLPFLFIV